LFDDATTRLERALIKTPPEIEQFKNLAHKANEIAIQNIKREVDYSDAPEEFRGFYNATLSLAAFSNIV
jgi:ubiquitin conjugation factor E4 B